MGLLRLGKKHEYYEADEAYVKSYLAGAFKASVKRFYILGDINQKYYQDTGEKIEKEKSQVFDVDRKLRVNWGNLYRALVRLERAGYITWFRLLKNGDLKVNWFTGHHVKKITPSKISYDKSEFLTPSCIPDIPVTEKKLIMNKPELHIVKRGGKPVYFHDIVPPRAEVEGRIKQDHINMHYGLRVDKNILLEIEDCIRDKSILVESMNEQNAVRAREFGAETSACDMWGVKFKLKPSYFSDEVTQDTRPLIKKWEKICMDRGYSIYPSPFYKTV